MIEVYQNPLVLTPTNTEHIYNVGSSNSGNTSFKYLVDVYMDVDTTPQRVARLKIQPNDYGLGIFDLQEIVVNYVFPNPRSEDPQNYKFPTALVSTPTGNTGTTINGTIINNSIWSRGFSNAYVGNTNTDSLYHIREYRAMIGEEWISGGTEHQEISTATTVPCSTFYVDINLEDNSVDIFNAGANIGAGVSPYSTGYNYYIYDNFLVFQSSGTSANINDTILGGSYTTGWYLYVEEIYTGIQYQFLQGAGGFWGKTTVIYPGDWSSYLSPCAVTIFPGTDSNKVGFDYSDGLLDYWSGSTNGSTNHLYNKAYDYRFTGSTYISDDNPARLLTTFGDDLSSVDWALTPSFQLVSDRVRHRNHHIDCPVLFSYFNGNVGLFSNPVKNLYSANAYPNGTQLFQSYNRVVTYSALSPDPTPVSQRIGYFTQYLNQQSIRGLDVPKSIYFFIASGGTNLTLNYSGFGISEVVRFDIVDDGCVSDPLHFCFLNQNGVWDTWTFDKRNVKRYDRSVSTYATGGIKNKSVYNRLMNEQRNVIYDYDVVERVDCQSWLMDENDKKIVEELFLSDYVYLIENAYSELDEPRKPYLIPITITTSSVESFKQRYNKLYQYSLSFEYNPIKTFRTSL